jgi:DNA-binding Xre family transcriptional regulator
MNLRKLIFDKEINQKILSQDTGISPPIVSGYYNNTFVRINKHDIEKLCRYFNCGIEDLFKIEDDEK